MSHLFWFVRFVVELPTFQGIIATASDNNKQYLLHFSAAVVIRNCVWLIVLAEVFNAQNCTYGVLGRNLLLIYVS